MSGIIGGAGAKSGVIGQTEIDYEEGTWQPAAYGTSGSAGSMDNSEHTGHYTKIGRLVTCMWKYTLTNNGSWGGSIYIGGLPYKHSSSTEIPSSGAVHMHNVNHDDGSADNDMHGLGTHYLPASQDYMYINMVRFNAGGVLLGWSKIGNDSAFRGTVSYWVDE